MPQSFSEKSRRAPKPGLAAREPTRHRTAPADFSTETGRSRALKRNGALRLQRYRHHCTESSTRTASRYYCQISRARVTLLAVGGRGRNRRYRWSRCCLIGRHRRAKHKQLRWSDLQFPLLAGHLSVCTGCRDPLGQVGTEQGVAERTKDIPRVPVHLRSIAPQFPRPRPPAKSAT
jgi:hypothetical protein